MKSARIKMPQSNPTQSRPSEAFRYSTFFSFKPDTPDWVRADFVNRWRAFMLACPEPQNPELNVPLKTEQTAWAPRYEFFSTMVFNNQGDCDAYLNHPLHVSLHNELIIPYADMTAIFGGRYEYRPIR